MSLIHQENEDTKNLKNLSRKSNLEVENINREILPITERNINLNTDSDLIEKNPIIRNSEGKEINSAYFKSTNVQINNQFHQHVYKENQNNENTRVNQFNPGNNPSSSNLKNQNFPGNFSNKKNYNLWRILFLTIHASTGFFFFGYNLACFNTMQENLSIILDWTEENKTIFISIISAILPFGSIFGALLSGKICAKIGRRYSFILINIIGIISTLISLIPNTYAIIVAKFVQGVCVGSFSTIVPLYVNEYVPKDLSGMCGIIYNSNFCLGILVSFLFGLNLPNLKEDIIKDNWWRFMFFFSSIPNLINTFLMLFVFKYDTPVFLLDKNVNKAKEALMMIYKDKQQVELIFQEMKNEGKKPVNKVLDTNMENNMEVYSSYSYDDVSYKMLCCKKYQKRLFILLILNIFQQLSLINPIGLFSNLIFLKSTDQKTATLFTAMTGVAEMVGSILTIFTIEKFGRKTLFLFGFFLTFCCHITVGVLYIYNYSDPQRYIIIFFYFLCGISVDPIIWIYNADVLPDKGVGLCTMTNWITAVVVIAAFPFLIASRLQPEGIFIIFGCITFLACLFALLFMKESKGKSQVEIEEAFK